MAGLPLRRSYSDRTRNTSPAVAVDGSVKILLVVTDRRAERTAHQRREAFPRSWWIQWVRELDWAIKPRPRPLP
jgi:hypothetical protein